MEKSENSSVILFSFENIRDAVSSGKEISTLSIYEQDKSFYFYIGLATGNVYEVDLGNGVIEIYGQTVNTAALFAKRAKSKKDRVAICSKTSAGLNFQL